MSNCRKCKVTLVVEWALSQDSIRVKSIALVSAFRYGASEPTGEERVGESAGQRHNEWILSVEVKPVAVNLG